MFAHLVPALHVVIIDFCMSAYLAPAGVNLPQSTDFRGLEVPGNIYLLLANEGVSASQVCPGESMSG